MSGTATWLISRANARAHSVLTDAFSKEGVRGYDFRILAALDQHGPASQADLGRFTGIDRSDVVVTLNALEAAGHATRSPDSADRRRNVVAITPSGRAILERLDAVLARVQDVVLEPLNPTERANLVQLLAKLID